jgi:hypothetical protein
MKSAQMTGAMSTKQRMVTRITEQEIAKGYGKKRALSNAALQCFTIMPQMARRRYTVRKL